MLYKICLEVSPLISHWPFSLTCVFTLTLPGFQSIHVNDRFFFREILKVCEMFAFHILRHLRGEAAAPIWRTGPSRGISVLHHPLGYTNGPLLRRQFPGFNVPARIRGLVHFRRLSSARPFGPPHVQIPTLQIHLAAALQKHNIDHYWAACKTHRACWGGYINF